MQTVSQLGKSILNCLNTGPPKTAINILDSVSLPCNKQSINQCLYQELEPRNLVKRINVGGITIPYWCLAPLGETKKQPNRFGCTSTVVLIDLGNIHDCLQKCEGLLQCHAIDRVYAFADYQFNGYGVKGHAVRGTNLQVIQAKRSNKNAAETLLQWKCQELIFDANRDEKFYFIIVTKDEGFKYLEVLVEEKGHVLHFARDSQDMNSLVNSSKGVNSPPPPQQQTNPFINQQVDSYTFSDSHRVLPDSPLENSQQVNGEGSFSTNPTIKSPQQINVNPRRVNTDPVFNKGSNEEEFYRLLVERLDHSRIS